MEKTYYTTEEIFPTVLRRSQVVGLEIVEISPLESALTDVEMKTKELAALCLRYESLARTTQQISTNSLAMSLNSAVDAPVNTGIPLYRQMFFNEEYLTRTLERTDLIEKLRFAIDDQVCNKTSISDWVLIVLSIGSSHRQLSKASRTSLSTGIRPIPRNVREVLHQKLPGRDRATTTGSIRLFIHRISPGATKRYNPNLPLRTIRYEREHIQPIYSTANTFYYTPSQSWTQDDDPSFPITSIVSK